MAIATITRSTTTINDGFGAYNDTVTGILVEHAAAGTHGVVTATSVATATITGLTTFTASGNLDIGSYSLRAKNLLADALTTGRVILTTTNGQLTTDSNLTFDTATLTVTNIAAFTLTGKLTAGATEIEGTGFDINGGAIDGTIIGANSAAAGTFAALTCTTFTSTGIDDNADATAITIDSSEKVFINDTVNTFALGPSLTIDGAGQNGEYLTLQSSTDVAHGMTDLTETVTFFEIAKGSAEGVAVLSGYGEGALGLQIWGYNVVPDTNHTNNSRAAVELRAAKKSGSGWQDLTGDENVVSIFKGSGTDCIADFTADGDLYLDTEVNINAWDEYNDAELVRAGRLMMRSNDNPIKKQFMGLVNKYSDDLIKWQLVNLNEDDPTHFMMGMKKWVMLNADTNWQNYERTKKLENKINKLENKLLALES